MLLTAIRAARAAGELLRDRYARPHEVTSKGFRDLVTEADVLAQEAIVAAIRAGHPSHQILTEEADRALGSDDTYRWFVDPLDGTTNFSRSVPHFSVSIAVEAGGEMFAAVVYDPLPDRLFYAEAGEGAYLNGKRLHVGDRTAMIDALVDLGWARSRPGRELSLRAAGILAPRVGSLRTMGSAALGLAMVAAGWEDLYYHPELAPWDMAAGALLVREAGGIVTSASGRPWSPFSAGCLAGNSLLHSETLRCLTG